MNPDWLLKHFEQVSEAPDAIPRLRGFILDLAVRGKLVPQDKNDEPASELLKRVESARNRQGNEGSPVKGGWKLSDIEEAEAPFTRPCRWQWIRIGECLEMINGRAFKPSDWLDSGLPIVRIQNLNNENAPFNYCDEMQVEERYIIATGCFLISWSGTPGTSFGAFIWGRGKAALNQHIFRCIQIGEPYCYKFLRIAINGRLDEMISKAHGGVGLQHITKGKLENLVLPLPPLAEQHRIVAKVDKLMSLCDELEAAQIKREKRRDRLVAATLHGLNNGKSEEEFRDTARFYFNHLPRLTTCPEHIKQLRQTILNLAVRGKLVRQDRGDEPACRLVARIQENRTRLTEEKKLKSTKPNNISIDNRASLLIPKNWAWGKFEELFFVTKLAGFEFTNYFELHKSGEIPVVRAQNVRPWKMDKSNLLYINKRVAALLERSALTKPCLLVTFIGAGIGDVALFDEDRRWHLAPNVAKVELLEGCESELSLSYLLMFLNSPFGRSEIFKHVKVTAQPSISMATIRDIYIPIPPHSEQDRIVAKVDELMKLCEELETNLTTSASTRRQLLEATIQEGLCVA